jgi:hypothetical protein
MLTLKKIEGMARIDPEMIDKSLEVLPEKKGPIWRPTTEQRFRL